MTYRAPRSLNERLAGTSARMVRGLLSARQVLVDTFEAVERVRVRGRASSDPEAEEDGEFDEELAENCQPIGLVARPAEGATIAAVVGNIGGDGTNPYILGTVDGTRALVIDARGIAADVTILYNSTDVLEIRDGKIRAGSLGGTTAPVAMLTDVQSLDARVTEVQGAVNSHTHLYAPGPGAPAPTATGLPQSGATATINGSQRVEVE